MNSKSIQDIQAVIKLTLKHFPDDLEIAVLMGKLSLLGVDGNQFWLLFISYKANLLRGVFNN